MVSLANGNGSRRGGYAFDEDSDDHDGENAPLLTQTAEEENSASRHIHIITGYISIIEALLLIVYTVVLVTITEHNNITNLPANSSLYTIHMIHYPLNSPDCTGIRCREWLVAVFCMAHTLLWLIVAVIDRVVQCQHQVMRRKGYLKFYRKMKNIRRIPFVMVSVGNAVLLVFISLLYCFGINRGVKIIGALNSTYILYIVIGLEMLASLPCVVYYIIKACWFNYVKSPPDVIRDTSSVSNSPTNTLTTVGFTDGEDLDELLERQADMIRYLQQHNASLGRRIMELQSRTNE